MIQIDVLKQDKKIKQIEIKGHAYSGDPGFDLVCAGISSIAVGALNAFDTLSQDCHLILDEKPYIKIECESHQDKNQLMLNFLLYQLKTVAEVHQEHVKINVKEESQ